MSDCPHHAGKVHDEPACELQRLADHTITVTQARAPWAACIMIVVDRDNVTHTALGASVPPDVAIALLTHHLQGLLAATRGEHGPR